MDSKCYEALQTAGNFLVKNNCFLSLFTFMYMARLFLVLIRTTLFQRCDSLGLYKVSVISQKFSSSIAEISSPAWSEHDVSISPICCPPQGLTLTLQKIKRRDKIPASQLSRANLVWSFWFSPFSRICHYFEFYPIFQQFQKVSHTCSAKLLLWNSVCNVTCLREMLIFHRTKNQKNRKTFSHDLGLLQK